MEQMKTGKFIAELRKEKGMTQEMLGEKLGVNSRSVSRWENGHSMPDISLLLELAEELGVTVQELLEGKRCGKKEEPELADPTDDTGENRQKNAAEAGEQVYAGLELVVHYLNQERAAWKKQMDFSLNFGLFCTGAAMAGYVGMILLGAYRGIDGSLSSGIFILLLCGFIRILQCQRMNKDEFNYTTEQLNSLMNAQSPKLRTAKEMLRFLKSHQNPEPDEKKCEKILNAIETELEPEETVSLVVQYSEYRRNALPMMWHVILAFTDHRLIIGGERQKGMLLVEYDTESCEKDAILSTRTENDGVQRMLILETAQAELTFTIGN